MPHASDLLREARTRASLSQTEVARRSGTSQAAVARYEAGLVSPAASTLERMLQVCGFTLGLRPVDPKPFLVDLIMSFRPEILERAEFHGATNLRIVGAAAQGEIDNGSNTVELLVASEAHAGSLNALAEDLSLLMGRRVTVTSSGPPSAGEIGPAHLRGIPL